jgi:hypothetical protein
METAVKTNTIYVKALRIMPKNFTSHYFTKKLRELGVDEYEIQNDYYYDFLSDECLKIKKAHWEKKRKPRTPKEKVEYTWENISAEQTPVAVSMTEEQMVEYLKANGYKVLKQIWNEI